MMNNEIKYSKSDYLFTFTFQKTNVILVLHAYSLPENEVKNKKQMNSKQSCRNGNLK